MAETRDIDADLDWLVGRIREGYEPEKIILFGSLARGDTHEWSDIDLIVVKDTDASYGRRVEALTSLIQDRPIGADILIYPLEEYERGKRARWGLVCDTDARAARVLLLNERSEEVASAACSISGRRPETRISPSDDREY